MKPWLISLESDECSYLHNTNNQKICLHTRGQANCSFVDCPLKIGG